MQMEKTEILFNFQKKKNTEEVVELENITGDTQDPTGNGPGQPAS